MRASLYKRTIINDYHAAHNPKTPLAIFDLAHQDLALAEIAEKIEEALLTVAPSSDPFPEPAPPIVPPQPPAPPAVQNIHGWSTSQVQALQRQIAQALKMTVEFQDALKDGGQGPVMAVIPGGRFLMGSPSDEPERRNNERQHEVEVVPFALGKYVVTFEEYDRFATATHRQKPVDEGWGRGRRPVINVSWLNAVAYAD